MTWDIVVATNSHSRIIDVEFTDGSDESGRVHRYELDYDRAWELRDMLDSALDDLDVRGQEGR